MTVDKPIPNTYDLGNLATFDPNPLDNEKLLSKDESIKEDHLQSVTRDNVQLLINQILSLPVKTTTETHGSSTGQNSTMTLIQLPEPTTILPRENLFQRLNHSLNGNNLLLERELNQRLKMGKWFMMKILVNGYLNGV